VSSVDWSYRPGRGEANVALHEPNESSGGRTVAVVTWKGDDHLFPYAPAAYFDKIFCNLRNDPLAARLLDLPLAVGELDSLRCDGGECGSQEGRN